MNHAHAHRRLILGSGIAAVACSLIAAGLLLWANAAGTGRLWLGPGPGLASQVEESLQPSGGPPAYGSMAPGDAASMDYQPLEPVKRWQIVRHIQIPMIRSAIVISVFFAITGALQLFDLIIPLSNGGPSHSSHTIVTFLYQFGILRMKLGFGGAISVMLFIACVIVALAYRRVLFKVEQN